MLCLYALARVLALLDLGGGFSSCELEPSPLHPAGAAFFPSHLFTATPSGFPLFVFLLMTIPLHIWIIFFSFLWSLDLLSILNFSIYMVIRCVVGLLFVDKSRIELEVFTTALKFELLTSNL